MVGMVAGAGLVAAVSANARDTSLEIVMTAAFVTGPLGPPGALAGLVAGSARARRARAPSRTAYQ